MIKTDGTTNIFNDRWKISNFHLLVCTDSELQGTFMILKAFLSLTEECQGEDGHFRFVGHHNINTWVHLRIRSNLSSWNLSKLGGPHAYLGAYTNQVQGLHSPVCTGADRWWYVSEEAHYVHVACVGAVQLWMVAIPWYTYGTIVTILSYFSKQT